MKLKKILLNNGILLSALVAGFMIVFAYVSPAGVAENAVATTSGGNCYFSTSYGSGCLDGNSNEGEYLVDQFENAGNNGGGECTDAGSTACSFLCYYCYADQGGESGGGGGGCTDPTTRHTDCPDGYHGAGRDDVKNSSCQWVMTSFDCVPDEEPQCVPAYSETTKSCGAEYLPGNYTERTNYSNPPSCTTTTVTNDESAVCTRIVYCEPGHTPAPQNNAANCPAPVVAPELDLKVNGAADSISILKGTPYTFTWSTTNSPSSCVLSLPQSQPMLYTNGESSSYNFNYDDPSNIWYPNPASSIIIRMTCGNSAGSTTDSVNVSFTTGSSARIAVSSNIATSWTITPGNPGTISAVGMSGSHTVYPGTSQRYTITPETKAGYTYTVANTKPGTGSGNSMDLVSGDDKSFTITYTASSCQAQTSETREVACDPHTPTYTSGSVTQTRTMCTNPAGEWSAWAYQGDTCGYLSSATINVTSNRSESWTINPGNITGTGSAARAVSPGSGTIYSITPADVSGYTWQVTNTKTPGTGASMTLVNGDNYTFSITYTAITPPGTDFTYSLSNNNSVNINKNNGLNAQKIITVTYVSGTAVPVDITLTSIPGVSAPHSPTTCTPSSGSACPLAINFSIPSNLTNGTYPITARGTVGNTPSVVFNLVVTGNPVSVTCIANPQVAKVGDLVTWTATATGGTGPYVYSWSGTSIPTPAPTGSTYAVRYSTVGIKNTTVTVSDNLGQAGSCANSTVQVNLNPKLEEF